VEARWAARAQDSGSTLLVSYDGDPECGVEIDGERLMQVFDILVENALAGGRGMIEVRLAVRPEGELVRLDGQVRDNTAGHDAEERLARLAGPMGQTTCRTVARSPSAWAWPWRGASCGRWARPARRGQSRRRRHRRLLADRSSRHDGRDPRQRARPVARAAHILIVDDNATNRMVAEALCEMFDCTSEQAVDGLEALDAVQARRFDLILMDIKMPRMDGVAATRAIRALPGPASKTPIIALTANADPDDVRGYLEAGMNDVVEKPIKAERMLAALRSALDAAEDRSAAA